MLGCSCSRARDCSGDSFLGHGWGKEGALLACPPKAHSLSKYLYADRRRRKDESLASDFFVQHQLVVNEIYCALKYGTMPVAGVSFRRWIAFHQPLTSGLRLIPDGYVEFATPAAIVAIFLEVDLGHESLRVWKEKARNYFELPFRDNMRAGVRAEQRSGCSSSRIPNGGCSRSARPLQPSTDKIFWFACLEVNRPRRLLCSRVASPTS